MITLRLPVQERMSNQTTILIVDDNPPMAETLADILIMKGYAVRTAFSGAEALGILKFENVHILLTDVAMPDMDGVTLYCQAKKNHPRLIAFLMTAYADDAVIQQGIDEGIETVLDKPVNIDFFLRLVAAFE